MSLEKHLMSLRTKHQQLDRAVASLEAAPSSDSLDIAQLKKEKLQLKEEIVDLESKITHH
ncbi:YdcH family protein [Phyllobacterium sophorae]|jgi:hypothetical protein|uniref:DUF465 domain-containing protein n=1 Tax=Phyllobacterium sophorae TaxID=1520277 RepID=A0A2P7BG65_9HYPH|nr:YdcH family protein [Phyllobacterium sophorae]PSH65457.1 DUF465 domain-containing protein [Phyllobacterium sophorae]